MPHVTAVSWSVLCAGFRRHAPAAPARGRRQRLPPLWPLRLACGARPLQRCRVGRHECLLGGRACASGRHARGWQSGASARGAGGAGRCAGGVCLGSVDTCQCQEGDGGGDQDSAGGGRGSARPPPPLSQGGVVHAATAALASFFFCVCKPETCVYVCSTGGALLFLLCSTHLPPPLHTGCNRCILDFTVAYSTRTRSSYCSVHTSLTLHHRCILPADWIWRKSNPVCA